MALECQTPAHLQFISSPHLVMASFLPCTELGLLKQGMLQACEEKATQHKQLHTTSSAIYWPRLKLLIACMLPITAEGGGHEFRERRLWQCH